jgi:two-component system sensor histidine kinase TctE
MALVDEDQEQRLNSLRAVVRNAEKLSRLLNQLLSDATVIHRADLKRFESFDLVEMINESIHDSLPFDSRIEVHFDTLLDEARYIGDPLLLREALKNLIDNALRYASGNDGPIDIELLDENSAYVLNVADRGPGISEVDRGRLFERFARGTHKTSGAGLGLAIVRQAVEGHGGRVSAIQRAGGGLIMQLWLPRRVS